MSTEPQLAFEISLLGKPAQVQLALLPWSEVARIAIVPEATTPDALVECYQSNLFYSVDRIDGKRFVRGLREAVDADPHARAAIFAHRFEIYQQIRGAGRMYARCPHCDQGEVEMSLLALFNTLGVLPPDMFSADLAFFKPPVSGETQDPPQRPTKFAYAKTVRVELPTKILGLPRASFEAGVLGRASYVRTERPLERWETDGVNVPVGKTWLTRRNAAFRATIWLIAALRDITPPGEVTLEAFEQLPAVDVYFLDAVYWLAFEVSVPEHALERSCPHCNHKFMPVAELAYEY